MSSHPRCRETVPLVRHGALALALAATLLAVPISAGDAPSPSLAVRREVAIDMASGWQRRVQIILFACRKLQPILHIGDARLSIILVGNRARIPIEG